MSENVYTAINAVMKEVGYVQKGGKMQYGDKYTYAKESDFIAAVRPLLVEHGVVVFPSGVLQLNQDTYPTNRGGEMNRDTAIIRFHFHHGASDTGFDVEVLGQGADSGDKSANKAMTAALKYALRQALLIETGDDPDDTASAQDARAIKKPASSGQPAAVSPDDKQFKEFMALGRQQYGDEWDDKRGDLVGAVTKGRTRSSLELKPDEFAKLLKGIRERAA